MVRSRNLLNYLIFDASYINKLEIFDTFTYIRCRIYQNDIH